MGARWFFGNPPVHWNPWLQLIMARLQSDIPKWGNITVGSRVDVGPNSIQFDNPLIRENISLEVRAA